MKIQVTQEDIDRGERHSTCRCPIALSVKREMGADFVQVDHMAIFAATNDGEVLTCVLSRHTPYGAHRFMERFDLGYPVEPYEFEI